MCIPTMHIPEPVCVICVCVIHASMCVYACIFEYVSVQCVSDGGVRKLQCVQVYHTLYNILNTKHASNCYV